MEVLFAKKRDRGLLMSFTEEQTAFRDGVTLTDDTRLHELFLETVQEANLVRA